MKQPMLRMVVILLLVLGSVLRAADSADAGKARLAWSLNAAVLHGIEYAGIFYGFTRDSLLVQLDVRDGTVLSELKTGFIAANDPLFSHGVLYVAGTDGILRSLDAAAGTAVWQQALPSAIVSGMTLESDRLYLACGRDASSILGFSRVDGKRVFAMPLAGHVAAPPAVSGGTLLLCTANGVFYTADLRSGLIMDSLQTRGEFYTQSAKADDGRFLLAPTGDAKELLCLSQNSRLSAPAAWSVSLARSYYPDAEALTGISLLRPNLRPALLKQYLAKASAAEPLDSSFMPAGPVHTSGWAVSRRQAAVVIKEPDCFGRALYRVMAYEQESGKPLFQYSAVEADVPSSSCADPVFTNDGVIVLTGPGTLSHISRSSGKALWTYVSGLNLKGPLWISENGILALSRDGQMVALTAENNEEVPAVFGMDQNTPNPFNPSTLLRYRVAVRGAASLKIYNARGQELLALVKGVKMPGAYTAVWNGCDALGRPAPTGIYFAVFKAGRYAKSVKMTLIK